MSDVHPTHSVTLFASIVRSKVGLGAPDQPLDRVIECLRAARKHELELREAHFALAQSRLKLTAGRCSQYFGSIKGLEALSGNSLFSQPVPIVSFGEDGDDDPEFSQIHKTIELFEELLSGIHNNDMTKIDEAIEKGRTILASHTIRKPLCPTVGPVVCAIRRVREFGNKGIQEGWGRMKKVDKDYIKKGGRGKRQPVRAGIRKAQSIEISWHLELAIELERGYTQAEVKQIVKWR
ncbi:hypothetical protein BJY52DRAFT_1227571 [Lactarius psammicola]|nr:hypothetical protein BJY52DRAFT_1227571 [Lactarius psammicola]